MDSSKDMFAKAYNLHYKQNNYITAYCIYEQIINSYPDSDEAKYAAMQMKNIEGIPSFKVSGVEKFKQEAFSYKSEEEISQERQKRLENTLITSGYNFEGYSITKYIKFISSESVLGMGFFKQIAASFSNLLGTQSAALSDKLKDAKSLVTDDLSKQAVDLGANAIIGIDLDYTVFGGELVGIVMSGTAVFVKKIE